MFSVRQHLFSTDPVLTQYWPSISKASQYWVVWTGRVNGNRRSSKNRPGHRRDKSTKTTRPLHWRIDPALNRGFRCNNLSIVGSYPKEVLVYWLKPDSGLAVSIFLFWGIITDTFRWQTHYGCLGMIAGINMESRVSYNVCIAMENWCQIRIFGDFVCNERNCAENKTHWSSWEIHAVEWYWVGKDTSGC